jgi:hypothetical protein
MMKKTNRLKNNKMKKLARSIKNSTTSKCFHPVKALTLATTVRTKECLIDYIWYSFFEKIEFIHSNY